MTRFATWNVNSLNVRLPRVEAWIADVEPDIVCMQETKTAADAFPTDELRDCGYSSVHHSGGRWAGVALLARGDTPAADVVCGLEGETEPGECRWLEATIDGMRIASVYVPNGRAVGTPTFAQKLAFLDAMVERLSALAGRPLIVAGDFNIAPGDIDVYNPKAFVGSTHVTVQERHRLQRMLSTGLVDAYRKVEPERQQFTWWDYRAGHFHKGFGLRIDLLLVSRDLAERLVSCGIDRNYRKGSKPSDHAPLLAEFSS